jgi:UDP-4-amino-4,6-dideoxy-N-acetyl-beta-L-altrosamine N-acetyltransferase
MSESVRKLEFVPILETSESVWEEIRLLRNTDNIRKYMYTDHIIEKDEHLRWLSSLRSSEANKVWVIQYFGKPIGIVSLNNINRRQRTADWAFYIREDLQGKGLGAAIEFQLIELAFNDEGLEKLNCEVLELNPGVVKLHMKFGFKQEGIRRKNILKEGRRIDVHLLGILKEEWAEIKPQLQRRAERMQ